MQQVTAEGYFLCLPNSLEFSRAPSVSQIKLLPLATRAHSVYELSDRYHILSGLVLFLESRGVSPSHCHSAVEPAPRLGRRRFLPDFPGDIRSLCCWNVSCHQPYCSIPTQGALWSAGSWQSTEMRWMPPELLTARPCCQY